MHCLTKILTEYYKNSVYFFILYFQRQFCLLYINEGLLEVGERVFMFNN